VPEHRGDEAADHGRPDVGEEADAAGDAVVRAGADDPDEDARPAHRDETAAAIAAAGGGVRGACTQGGVVALEREPGGGGLAGRPADDGLVDQLERAVRRDVGLVQAEPGEPDMRADGKRRPGARQRDGASVGSAQVERVGCTNSVVGADAVPAIGWREGR
jgi:hypothetical protein